MKSEKVVKDLLEYLILFGSRDNPIVFRETIECLNWILQDDLTKKYKIES